MTFKGKKSWIGAALVFPGLPLAPPPGPGPCTGGGKAGHNYTARRGTTEIYVLPKNLEQEPASGTQCREENLTTANTAPALPLLSRHVSGDPR